MLLDGRILDDTKQHSNVRHHYRKYDVYDHSGPGQLCSPAIASRCFFLVSPRKKQQILPLRLNVMLYVFGLIACSHVEVAYEKMVQSPPENFKLIQAIVADSPSLSIM